MARLRKNDQVIVKTGKDRGKVGRVTQVLEGGQRVIIEKVNVVKRHTRPTQKNPQGGITEKESSVHASNVMLLDPKSGAATRVKYQRQSDGKKIRIAAKSGEAIEAK